MRNISRIIPFLLICAIASCNIQVSDEKPVGLHLQHLTPEEAGFSPESLELLDSLFESYVNKQAIASAEVMVVRKGGIAYHRSFSPEGASEPKDSIYRIMSMTKAITSVAAMQLYEQGKFMLDDPVEKYIPELGNMYVLQAVNQADSSFTALPAQQSITIRDLLRHTSGFAYGFSSPEMQMLYEKAGLVEAIAIDTEVQTLEENMKVLGILPLLHEPGTRYTYGVSTDVLGYLVEVVSGRRFDEYLLDQIFAPLGMDDSYFFVPSGKAGRLAKVYYNTAEEPLVRMEDSPITDYHSMAGQEFFSGGAGLSTTAADYAKFLQMLLNGGEYNGARILGPKTIDLMVTNQLKGIVPRGEPGSDEFAFGLGFQLGTGASVRRKPGSLNRYSWGGMLSTTYWWDAENDLAVVGMIQMLPFYHNEMWEKMEVIIYGALENRVPGGG